MKGTSSSENIKCPKCQSDAVKNGKDSGKQRYRCTEMECRCNFRRPLPAASTNIEEKRKCLMMYLAGVSVRDIHATLSKIDQQTIRRWIERYGSSLEPIVNKKNYGFRPAKAVYLSDDIETEIGTGILFVEKLGKIIISPLEETPNFFNQMRKEAMRRKWEKR